MKTAIASAVLTLAFVSTASANLQPAPQLLMDKDIERIEILYENSLDYALSKDTKKWLMLEMDIITTDTYHRVRDQNLSAIKAFELNRPVSGGLAQTTSVR